MVMGYFSDRDRALIEALEYDPAATPGFELLKGCLVWADERPDGLTSEGYDHLCDLWIARAFLHQGRPFTDAPLGGRQFERAWAEALSEGIRWPGFRRVELSAEDRAYYESALHDLETGDY